MFNSYSLRLGIEVFPVHNVTIVDYIKQLAFNT